MNARRVHHCRNCRRDTTQELVREITVASQLVDDRATPLPLPPAELWRCLAPTCGIEILAFVAADRRGVPDAEGLCLFVLNEKIRPGSRGDAGGRRDGRGLRARHATNGDRRTVEPVSDDRRLDWEDALGHLREQVYVAYSRWNPTLGVPFRAWATTWLRNRLLDWLRAELGRDVPKLHALAESYEAALEEIDGNGEGLDVRRAANEEGYRRDLEGGRLEAALVAWTGDPAVDCSPDLEWALAV